MRHGRLVTRTLRKERISVDELMAKLREHGIDDLGLVRVALLEADGKISVIRKR
ncbi:YetF domain-containing protein [Variovorax sp. CCNWLW186]